MIFSLFHTSYFIIHNSYFFLKPASPLTVGSDKCFHRTVIGSFDIVGEIAGRELPHTTVVRNTLAADTHPRTGRIGAIAVFSVFVFIAGSHSVLFHFSRKERKGRKESIFYNPLKSACPRASVFYYYLELSYNNEMVS